jgi:hypothetical protein
MITAGELIKVEINQYAQKCSYAVSIVELITNAILKAYPDYTYNDVIQHLLYGICLYSRIAFLAAYHNHIYFPYDDTYNEVIAFLCTTSIEYMDILRTMISGIFIDRSHINIMIKIDEDNDLDDAKEFLESIIGG